MGCSKPRVHPNCDSVIVRRALRDVAILCGQQFFQWKKEILKISMVFLDVRIFKYP